MPSRSVLELQYDCNLRCKTCNIWKKKFKTQRKISGSLSTEDIFKIQSGLASAGISQISYVGGEPFLQKNISDVISNARANRLSTAVVTNGALMDSASINHLFDSGLDTIIFSIDGPAKIHDNIRGVDGTFDKAFNAIRKIQQLKKKKRKKRPRVNIYTTISAINHLYVLNMLDIARKLDVNAIRLQLVSVVDANIAGETNKIFQRDVVGYHSYAVNPDLNVIQNDLLNIKKKMTDSRRWSKETGIQLQIESCLGETGAIKTCQFVNRSFVINPIGEVLPCPMLTGYSIGNILENGLENLWKNEDHLFFLDRLKHFKKFPVCKVCCVEKLNNGL